MVLIYIVELQTAPTFTARKTVKNETEANAAVDRLCAKNKKKGYVCYSGFELYDQLNVVGQTPKSLKKWNCV